MTSLSELENVGGAGIRGAGGNTRIYSKAACTYLHVIAHMAKAPSQRPGAFVTPTWEHGNNPYFWIEDCVFQRFGRMPLPGSDWRRSPRWKPQGSRRLCGHTTPLLSRIRHHGTQLWMRSFGSLHRNRLMHPPITHEPVPSTQTIFDCRIQRGCFTHRSPSTGSL